MLIFGVWAPSQDAFWQSWVAAGICTAPGVFAPQYAGSIETTAGTWPGVVLSGGAPVPGWHCNVRVFGALETSFTAGLQQTDGAGNLLGLWQRTRAAQAFGLTQQPADAETGFPAGYRSASGVTYADAADFTSPSNVWM